jgi:hypothetical protein
MVDSFVTNHRSPFAERWGGWFVTGAHGAMRHMGNVQAADPKDAEKLDRERGANRARAPADLELYAAPHSDIVALMTLEHQTMMHNYLARAGMEARIALYTERALNKALGKPEDEVGESAARRIGNAAEIVARNLLFAGEAPLTAAVKGTSGFAAEFSRQGPHDLRGRSLREFDLQTRMFRYPCSYLVYSPAFAQLPAPLKDRVFARLEQALSGDDRSGAWAHLPGDVRRAVREILRETLPGYPRE